MVDVLRRSKRVSQPARPSAQTNAPQLASKPKVSISSPTKAQAAAKATAVKSKSNKAVNSRSTSAKAPGAKQAAPLPATTATSIDHKAYPHIFEQIVEHAPYASLLALRAASKTLRQAIDLRLGSHVVLRAGLPPPKGAKWARTAGYLPRGPAKQRPRQTRINVAARDGQLPGFVCDYLHVPEDGDSCGADCTALRERWEAVFATSTTLDLHPWITGGGRLWTVKTKFPALKVVRFYPYEYMRCEFMAETIVVFTTFENPEPKRYAAVVPAPTCFLDKVVRRMVVHATYDCKRPTLHNCWVTLPMLEEVEEVVMIFEPVAGSTVCTNPEWGESQRPNGWLWDIVCALRVGSKVQFTVVGALEAPPLCLGVGDGVERGREELEAVVLHNIVEYIREDDQVQSKGGLMAEREGEIRSQLTFASVEEYRKEVGEAQWAIEAVPTAPCR